MFDRFFLSTARVDRVPMGDGQFSEVGYIWDRRQQNHVRMTLTKTDDGWETVLPVTGEVITGPHRLGCLRAAIERMNVDLADDDL